MERDESKFTIPYATGDDRPADVHIERFPDGGVTITIPRRPVRLVDQLIIAALALGPWVWIVGSTTGFSAWPLANLLRSHLHFWVSLLLVASFTALLLSPRRSQRRRRPNVIGISSTTVYLDVAGWVRYRPVEVPRHDLRGIELVFPRQNLSTRPSAVRIRLAGRQPIERGNDCAPAQVLTIFAEFESAVLRTSRT